MVYMKCYLFMLFFNTVKHSKNQFFFYEQEYVEDGIDWAKVDFEDNQDCLSLFEKVWATICSLMSLANDNMGPQILEIHYLAFSNPFSSTMVEAGSCSWVLNFF